MDSPDTRNQQAAEPKWLAGVFEMFGLGRDLWLDENADDYVARMREHWDSGQPPMPG